MNANGAHPAPDGCARRLWLQRLAASALALPLTAPVPVKAQTAKQAQAQDLLSTNGSPAPALLTISGKLRKTGAEAQAGFNLASLSGFPQTTHVTRTPWYSEERAFTGPLLRDLLQACNADGQTMRLLALNDYRADMPVSDTQKYDVIVAHLIDGKPVAVRDKGPLFVMYPFGAKSELRSTLYYARAVWQLRSIEVL